MPSSIPIMPQSSERLSTRTSRCRRGTASSAARIAMTVTVQLAMPARTYHPEWRRRRAAYAFRHVGCDRWPDGPSTAVASPSKSCARAKLSVPTPFPDGPPDASSGRDRTAKRPWLMGFPLTPKCRNDSIPGAFAKARRGYQLVIHPAAAPTARRSRGFRRRSSRCSLPPWPTSSTPARPTRPGRRAGAPRPLADRLRPRRLDEVVGQDHLLGPDGPLGRMLAEGNLGSIVFWGPPGSRQDHHRPAAGRRDRASPSSRSARSSPASPTCGRSSRPPACAAPTAAARCCSSTRSTASTAPSRTPSCR